jgi:hypothetical protein
LGNRASVKANATAFRQWRPLVAGARYVPYTQLLSIPLPRNRYTECLRLCTGSHSTAASCFLATRDFRERASVGCDGFRNSLVVDELPFAATGDEVRFAENFEMVRNSRGSDPAHGDNVATVHVVGCRDSLEDPKAGSVSQSFRYLLNLGTVHGQSRV